MTLIFVAQPILSAILENEPTTEKLTSFSGSLIYEIECYVKTNVESWSRHDYNEK